MTEDQYQKLLDEIYALRSSVADMQLQFESLKRLYVSRHELEDHRFELMYEWCASEDYKRMAESEVMTTDDVTELFKTERSPAPRTDTE